MGINIAGANGDGSTKICNIPSGKQPHNYVKSPFSMAKSTISMGHSQ
jgi:hypothetical protein